MLCFLIACLAGEDEESLRTRYPEDSRLRITDAQVWGTHNSYHIEPENNMVTLWDYTHRPLNEQLDQGIRQFEIDIVYEPESEEILVQHIPFVDAESNCINFVSCLQTLKDWSEQHPWHFPLQILIEPKDELEDWSVVEHFDVVDAHIWSIWGESIWTPADQQSDFGSLRESILSDGWPTLEVLRGRAVFVLLDTGEPRAVYTDGLQDVSERPIFPVVSLDHPLATYSLRDDPFDSQIETWISQGFLVRTRGDVDLVFESDRLEQAFAAGAHAISVDTEASLSLIHADHPVQCNPVTSSNCQASDLE